MQFYSSSRASLFHIARDAHCNESATNRPPELLDPFVYPLRSTIGRVWPWPGNARFSFVQEIKGTRHHYVRVELVPDELESSLEYPLLLAVVEFHLRNNIPRISFVEIHSPLLEPVHYCESFATTDCFCVCGKRVTKCTVSLEWNGIFGIEDCAGSKFIVTTIFKFDNGVARMCGSLSSWKIYMLFSSRYL